MSEQFAVDAMEMTGSEILAYLERLPGKISFQKYRAEIDRVLNLWDLMKFAEFVPTPEVLEANLDSTVKLARRLAMEYRAANAVAENDGTSPPGKAENAGGANVDATHR